MKLISSQDFFADYLAADIDTTFYPLLHFRVSLAGCLLYVAIFLLFRPPQNATRSTPHSFTQTKCFTAFIFCHNMILAIFSALCFLNTAPALWKMINHPGGWHYACKEGWKNEVCSSL